MASQSDGSALCKLESTCQLATDFHDNFQCREIERLGRCRFERRWLGITYRNAGSKPGYLVRARNRQLARFNQSPPKRMLIGDCRDMRVFGTNGRFFDSHENNLNPCFTLDLRAFQLRYSCSSWLLTIPSTRLSRRCPAWNTDTKSFLSWTDKRSMSKPLRGL